MSAIPPTFLNLEKEMGDLSVEEREEIG